MTRKDDILEFIEEVNAGKMTEFHSLGNESVHYTQQQKEFAFDLIEEKGIRATALILSMHRRTLQRWCREQGVDVKPCPDWVYDWASRGRLKNCQILDWRSYYNITGSMLCRHLKETLKICKKELRRRQMVAKEEKTGYKENLNKSKISDMSDTIKRALFSVLACEPAKK